MGEILVEGSGVEVEVFFEVLKLKIDVFFAMISV